MSARRAAFLRSVNLGLDLASPERFAHFAPTPKSAQVIRAVALGEPSPATMVVAAYGSGKSLAAGFACMAMSGGGVATACDPSRLEEVDPVLARRLEGLRGLPVVLDGAYGDVAGALVTAASSALGTELPRPGRQGVTVVLDAIAVAAKERGFDLVAIVWDEFGRHLESLAAEGRAHELAQLQQAAEWAVRQDRPAATLTLLLHQGVFHYTGGLGQAARSAWRKVEGRFGAVRFVDDSGEMHRLIASVAAETRPTPPPLPPTDFTAAAERSLAAGLFPAFSGAAALAETLKAAWPLDPAALHVLPGLAARVAQHERSVFAFLDAADLSRRVTLKDVYDHFSPAMEADVGIGGSHRRWLEAESALSKAEGPDEALVIAAAALLGLGASGQRVKVSRDTLLAAVAPYGDGSVAAKAVESLLARKLLLHRHRTDDVAVWHGTDLDLRGRIEEERSRIETDFDLVGFLSVRRPAPAVRPVRHNLDRWIRRAWTGAYASASDLCAAGAGHPLLKVEPGEDGRVLYVVAEGVKEAEAALATVPSLLPADGGVIACVSAEPLPLAEHAMEIACLGRLSEDEALVGSDPLAEAEIAHMTDAAMEALDRLLDRAVAPGRGRQHWFALGKPVDVRDAASLAEALSDVADRRFPDTPRIRNESVVRRKLSRPMVNARKRLLLCVLERDGEPHLGCEFGGGTPDIAMYRTVLYRTGLYREEQPDGTWGWAPHFDLKDAGLRAVWMEIQRFFQTPGLKPFGDLVTAMLAPPFGLRQGLLPILTAAGLKAFGRAVAIRRDGAWLKDVLASEVEEMCSRPQAFEVEVFDLSGGIADYLRGLAEEFGAPAPEEADLLRHAQDALHAWKVQRPEGALTTRHPDQTVRLFQQALAPGHDPVEVIFRRLPKVARADGPGPETLDMVRRCRMAIEAVVEGHQAEAVRIVCGTLALPDMEGGDALASAKAWASCFAGAFAKPGGDQAAKALLARASAATDGRYTEVSFARAVSMLLLGLDFDRWTERTPAEFARRLKAVAEQVEEAALAAGEPDAALRPIIEARAGDLLAKLVRIAGRAAAEELLARVAGTEGNG
ncbi:hypothetical protein HL658_19850 [Azospirillum sp. RWY-5-1]|uniref:ATP-binding protein n=1 Tax=Azospirillum oleiclasticum TaxID=2735135 RepID=A0ABX2TGA7_9PROT|nr:hypothetical protein [Azospirillum oleiclasticum]NYZ14807.1 hypothetical protein [Azospirillum oleiclasticum]NYZ22207.1 hypothetical protein [Azospirillum oleiclasticum]